MKSHLIREKFIGYFEALRHAVVPSARLVPDNDPTLFFVNAGMVPFKRYFTGEEKPPYRRAVSSQKCLRVSGKHNDLENVGVTARHHTFFEMLGNFSFGDYFKKDAILWGWEFLTGVCGLPKEKLWVTVFKDDDEAAALWEKETDVLPGRIVRLGEKDNFWSMGPTGPCGPCSEIHIDRGGDCGLGHPNCGVDCDCDRFLEIWNLVFMQFNRDESGTLTPLPHPSIDTGMGLERLSMVLQGKTSNYDTDLFRPIIDEICALTGKRYGANRATDISIQVLADHSRAMSFLIADGVLPSNEGAGYVLRRIMRRAIRHGRLLGMNEPFFYKLHDVLAREMGGAYRELELHAAFVKKVAAAEESRFLETLDKGTALLEDEMERLKREGEEVLPGALAFKLYDTYGFPADLTEIMLKERGFSMDADGFEAAMRVQQDQGREARREKGLGGVSGSKVYAEMKEKFPKTVFTGYERFADEAKILAIVAGDALSQKASPGDRLEILLDRTPFYPEGGGQAGDCGIFKKPDGACFKVETTRRVMDGLIVHTGQLISGELKVGDSLSALVEEGPRRAAMRHHTATHLLHAALRRHLGEHVKQAGSLVDSHRLRFDFNHFEPVSKAVLREIEREINGKISEDIALFREELDYEAAIEKGALAFFGEKYGKRVRVVQVGDYSTELCGGTHVARTGEIGLFKIVSESGIASGVRRIEAVAGPLALERVHHVETLCGNFCQTLKAEPDQVLDRLDKLQAKVKKLEKENEALRRKSEGASWREGLKKTADGVSYLAFETAIQNGDALRVLSDQIRAEMGPGVILLVGRGDDKVFLLSTVSSDLTARYKAGEIIRSLTPLVGGKGGGKADFAQGGGTDLSRLSEIASQFSSLICARLDGEIQV